MTADFEIRGAEELEKLARRLKETGSGDLRKELLRGIRNAGADTIPEIRKGMLEELPSRGGFAAKAARDPIAVRTRTSGKSAGVRIERKRGAGLNRGRLRRPLFGNREHWFEQRVPTGWYDRAIEGDGPEIQRKVLNVMQDIAKKLVRGL